MNKKMFYDVIGITFGAVATFILSFSTNPVFAASLIGLIAAGLMA